jgi:exodeoxyribonuclease V alpha subunit
MTGFGSGQTTRRSSAELKGTVRKVIWSDPESGAHVLALALDNGEERVCKGNAEPGEIDVGMTLRFLGRHEHHHRHGEQFAWQTFIRQMPHDRAGILKYLTDLAPHVGRITAQRLWDAFQGDAERVLRCEPERVAAAGIMSPENAVEAAAALQHESAFADTKIDLFGLFAGRGFHTKKLIPALLARWGKRSPNIVRHNPFGLLVGDFPSCSFRRCDKLFIDLGGSRDDLKRQTLAAWNFMHEDTSGHTWYLLADVERAIAEVCAGPALDPPAALKIGIVSGLLSRCRLYDGRLWIAEGMKAKNEWVVSEKVKDLLAYPRCVWPRELPAGLLTPHQSDTVYPLMTRPVIILAGTPGTGKTYTAAVVIKQVLASGIGPTAICAPTGKAAVRISAAMQRYGINKAATTIHRLLGVLKSGRDGKGWGFKYGTGRKNLPDELLPIKFLVVDEVSMLDTDLAAALFGALAPGTHVLLVGDPYQLPPVGHGAVLRDLIRAQVPCGLLTEIKRQDGPDNLIVKGCVEIKDGQPPKTCDAPNVAEGRNLWMVRAHSGPMAVEELQRIIRALRAEASRADDLVWDVQVLCPRNAVTPVSRQPLNLMLQAELNPAGRAAEAKGFRVGDKIICLKNSWMPVCVHVADADEGLVRGTRKVPRDGPRDDAERYVLQGDLEAFVANGEQGQVVAVAPRLAVADLDMPPRRILIRMGRIKDDDREEGEEGTEIKGSGCDFTLAYAVTIHKSQGSEWPVVIVMLDQDAGFLGVRELAYTAISRASKLCVLIGKTFTLAKWTRKESLSKRRTFLAELMGEAAKPIENAGAFAPAFP